ELSSEVSPQGFCPACLLKLGLSSPGMHAAERETVAPLSVQSRPSGHFALIAVIVAILIVAVTAVVVSHSHTTPLPPPVHFTIAPSADASDFAISPDGRLLTFTAPNSEGTPILRLRAFDSFESRPLAGTDNAAHPFWSPDSRSIAYFADGKLRR